MKHIWTVVCQNSQIDRDTNNLSITNVLEQLVISVNSANTKTNIQINIPLVYEVVSFWVKEEGEKIVKADVIVEIVDPRGAVLKSFKQPIEMLENIKRFRTRFQIQGIGLTITGNYKFIIKVKESKDKEFKIVSEVPLEVHINSASSLLTKN